MHTEIYKGCKIKSTPHQLIDEGDYRRAVNGIIEINSGSHVTHIMIQNLNIPDDEWKHFTETDADNTFIKFAKLFIDKNITYS